MKEFFGRNFSIDSCCPKNRSVEIHKPIKRLTDMLKFDFVGDHIINFVLCDKTRLLDFIARTCVHVCVCVFKIGEGWDVMGNAYVDNVK